jgi:hypothetical protein
MKFNNREDIIQLTPLWEGERFPDGRPRVSDEILRKMKNVVTEEAWSVLWREGYQFQFEGNWTRLHPERVEFRKYCPFCDKHTPHKETR